MQRRSQTLPGSSRLKTVSPQQHHCSDLSFPRKFTRPTVDIVQCLYDPGLPGRRGNNLIWADVWRNFKSNAETEDAVETGGHTPAVAQRLTPHGPRQPRQLHSELQSRSHCPLFARRGLALLTPLFGDLNMKSRTHKSRI